MSTTNRSAPRGLIRQGDVLLVPVDEVPEETRVEGRCNVILARGEATGHAHRIVNERAEVRAHPWQDVRYLVVRGVEPVTLEHEEHDPILVAPGAWEIRRQREYVPALGRTRWVSD